MSGEAKRVAAFGFILALAGCSETKGTPTAKSSEPKPVLAVSASASAEAAADAGSAPLRPRFAAAAGVRRAAVSSVAPAAIAAAVRANNAFAVALREVIGDLASISDQSDAYAILRLAGTQLRDTLAKIVAIDLHPRAFGPGAVASTMASQIGATLWRLEDDADGSPVFEIAVPRSLAQSFWHALWGHDVR